MTSFSILMLKTAIAVCVSQSVIVNVDCTCYTGRCAKYEQIFGLLCVLDVAHKKPSLAKSASHWS